MSPPVLDAQAAIAVIAFAFIALGIFEALRAGAGAASGVSWESFEAGAARAGLADDDRGALAAWAKRAALEDPSLVLADRAAFDRFVRDEVALLDRREQPQGGPGRRAALARLSALRKKLGHEPPPPPAPIVSSRDIAPRARLTVRPDAPAGGSAAHARFEVASADEEALELCPHPEEPAEPAFYEAAAPGRGVWVVFGRAGDTTWRFRSRVLARPGLEPPLLALTHGEFLVKEERRRAARIGHRLAVRVLSVDGDEGRAFEAATLDLSSGGLAIVSPRPVPRGARLALDLPLESPGSTIGVSVLVVGAGLREDQGPNRHFLNARFVDMPPASRGRLQTFLGAARRTASG